MAWLRSEWGSLVESGDFLEAVLAACQFGSPHQKEFRFLAHGLLEELEGRCTRDHAHVRMQGSYTKASAIYQGWACTSLSLSTMPCVGSIVSLRLDGLCLASSLL